MDRLHTDGQHSPAKEPKRLRAEEGAVWFAESWRIFKKDKFKWIAALFSILLLIFAAQTIFLIAFGQDPFSDTTPETPEAVGVELAANILTGWLFLCLIGGVMKVCEESGRGAGFRFGVLFAGFSRQKIGKFIKLFLWSVLLIACLSAVIIAGIETGLLRIGLLFYPVILVVSFVFFMLTWLTVPLIMLEDMEPLAAIKTSFAACCRNMAACLVYGLCWLILGIGLWLLVMLAFILAASLESQLTSDITVIALIIFYILGFMFFLIAHALAYIGIYTSYRSIFPQGCLSRPSSL